jgi:hypothetical protein
MFGGIKWQGNIGGVGQACDGDLHNDVSCCLTFIAKGVNQPFFAITVKEKKDESGSSI